MASILALAALACERNGTLKIDKPRKPTLCGGAMSKEATCLAACMAAIAAAVAAAAAAAAARIKAAVTSPESKHKTHKAKHQDPRREYLYT